MSHAPHAHDGARVVRTELRWIRVIFMLCGNRNGRDGSAGEARPAGAWTVDLISRGAEALHWQGSAGFWLGHVFSFNSSTLQRLTIAAISRDLSWAFASTIAFKTLAENHEALRRCPAIHAASKQTITDSTVRQKYPCPQGSAAKLPLISVLGLSLRLCNGWRS